VEQNKSFEHESFAIQSLLLDHSKPATTLAGRQEQPPLDDVVVVHGPTQEPSGGRSRIFQIHRRKNRQERCRESLVHRSRQSQEGHQTSARGGIEDPRKHTASGTRRGGTSDKARVGQSIEGPERERQEDLRDGGRRHEVDQRKAVLHGGWGTAKILGGGVRGDEIHHRNDLEIHQSHRERRRTKGEGCHRGHRGIFERTEGCLCVDRNPGRAVVLVVVAGRYLCLRGGIDAPHGHHTIHDRPKERKNRGKKPRTRRQQQQQKRRREHCRAGARCGIIVV